MKGTTVVVEIRFLEELLGTTSGNPELAEEFILSRAPNAERRAEERAALKPPDDAEDQEVVERSMTVFPRNGDGQPFLWDYQIKGFFKDACGMLARIEGTESKALKAYKKIIDGLIFVEPRQIETSLPDGGEIGHCQRPLRAQTAKGERIALAMSETVPPGSRISFTVRLLNPDLFDALEEWLDYGALRGLGQWRNSGKGRFSYELREA